VSAPASGPWGAGKFGGALLADGTSGCVDLGSALALEGTSFTVAVWARPHGFSISPTLGRYFVGRANEPGTAGWRFGTDPNDTFGLKLRDSSGTTYALSVTGQAKDTWTHVAVTFVPGDAVRVYLGGALSFSHALATIVPDNAATLRIGCRNDGQNVADGAIDEVRIYGRRFTDAEVASLAAKIP
jgi:hypothetical protein